MSQEDAFRQGYLQAVEYLENGISGWVARDVRWWMTRHIGRVKEWQTSPPGTPPPIFTTEDDPS